MECALLWPGNGQTRPGGNLRNWSEELWTTIVFNAALNGIKCPASSVLRRAEEKKKKHVDSGEWFVVHRV